MEHSVLVEVDAAGEAIRIFRTAKAAAIAQDRGLHGFRVEEKTRRDAVREIRRKIFARATNYDGITECEDCGAFITWETGEMHEDTPKGKGGDVSVENGRALCHGCHTGRPDSRHGERRWHTARTDRK